MHRLSLLIDRRLLILWLVVAATMVLLLSAFSAAAAPAESCGRPHWVKKGDTLSSISRQYGVSQEALLGANPQITDPNRIYAGTALRIPCFDGEGGQGGMCRAEHRVQYGDTLFKISRTYRVPPYAIVRTNNIQNPDRIYAGDTLCIP